VVSSVDRARHASPRGLDLLDRVDYRLCETDAEREEVYRMRYRAYLNDSIIEPRADHRLTDRFDDAPNSWTFAVYFDGEPASSLRISLATPEMPSTPSVEVFSDVLEPFLAQGKIIVDPTRFVADPCRARKMPELPYFTLRLAYVACEYFNADLGTAAVRAEHQAFYRRVFMHDVLGEPRFYPQLAKPFSLMAVDFKALRSKVFQRYPIFRSTLFERRMLFTRRQDHARPTMVTLREPGKSQISIAPHDPVRTERIVAVGGAAT
jgi:hypothetical protein